MTKTAENEIKQAIIRDWINGKLSLNEACGHLAHLNLIAKKVFR